jgi:hypothetical protein
MMQGGGGNDAISGGMMSSETIMVPDKMVGLIIGRGGEQVWNFTYYYSRQLFEKLNSFTIEIVIINIV